MAVSACGYGRGLKCADMFGSLEGRKLKEGNCVALFLLLNAQEQRTFFATKISSATI